MTAFWQTCGCEVFGRTEQYGVSHRSSYINIWYVASQKGNSMKGKSALDSHKQ